MKATYKDQSAEVWEISKTTNLTGSKETLKRTTLFGWMTDFVF